MRPKKRRKQDTPPAIPAIIVALAMMSVGVSVSLGVHVHLCGSSRELASDWIGIMGKVDEAEV